MIFPSGTTVIDWRNPVGRREPQAGLIAPAKAIDAATGLLQSTAKRQAVFCRLDRVASSVAMSSHRSVPSSLPDNKTRPVTAAPEGEVMSK